MSFSARTWTEAARPSPLEGGQVHLWRIALSGTSAPDARLDALLSPGERQRAARFHFDRDRQRFRIAHAALRALLSAYLGLPMAEIQFETNAYGKPLLNDRPDLHFNLSHAHELALLAVTRQGDVGVDIEYIQPDLADLSVARKYFSPAEVQALAALPAELQPDAFFNCWTRKEAFIKARGMGLSLPLDGFEVSLRPGFKPVALATYSDPQEARQWTLRALDPAPGYTGAVAVRGADFSAVQYQWRPDALEGDTWR